MDKFSRMETAGAQNGAGNNGCDGDIAGAVSEIKRQQASSAPNSAGTSPPNAGWGQVDHSKEPKTIEMD